MLENARRQKPDPLILRVLAEALDLNYADLFLMIGHIDQDILSAKHKALYYTSRPRNKSIWFCLSRKWWKLFLENLLKLYISLIVVKIALGFIKIMTQWNLGFPDNSIVVVNTDIEELEHRSVGVFLINGESYIKSC